jgi:hypothetical protein
MIQRIQSIYLLLVIFLSIGATFFLKLWVEADNEVFAFDLFSNESILHKLVAIFCFNDRQQQFVLGRIIILINLFLLGILIYLSLNIPGEIFSEKGIGMFIPSFVILFSVLANKAIRKDENLVKSVDRLR